MSAASDVTLMRQIIAKYAVASAGADAWKTTYPISTSDTITAANMYSEGPITAMSGIKVPNTYASKVTLASGSNTVTTSACRTTSLIYLTYNTFVNQGVLRATAGNGSFTITSTSGTDASVVQWFIVNPA
jgi:hypothetical protein